MTFDDPSAHVSHETTFAAIYVQRRSELKAAMIEALRQTKLVRGRGCATLVGTFNRSSVGTLDERKTRFVALYRMNGNGAAAALDTFTRQMKRLPAVLRKGMNYDRGSEMACHPELARRLKIDIWFCDPNAPWQWDSNENTDGLLHKLMPKRTDHGDASQIWLNDVAALMNNRPRKTLDCHPPAEAMPDKIAAFKSTIALEIRG